MQTGQAGKKYGLIMPTRPGAGAVGAGRGMPAAAARKAPQNVANVFGDDSDEEETGNDVNKELERQQARLRANEKVRG